MWIINNAVLDYRGKVELSKNIETKEDLYATISLNE